MYSRTASDSLKLRRLITSLKETGSDLASQLEDQSASFFTGVQVVRSNNANRVRFDSDEEDNDEFSCHTETIRRHRASQGKGGGGGVRSWDREAAGDDWGDTSNPNLFRMVFGGLW